MLKQRLLTSAVLVAALSVLIYLDANYSKSGCEGLWLLPFLLFFALGTASDIASTMQSSGRLIAYRVTLVATAIVTLSGCVPLLWPLMNQTYPPDCGVGQLGWIVGGGIVAIFLLLSVEMAAYGKVSAESGSPSGATERITHAVFASLYAGMPMALLVPLRGLGDNNWGLAALLTTIAVTKSADAGAYFTGKAIGKHKLIPRLSPGKTWEGAIGGIVTATIVAFVCLSGPFWEADGNDQMSTISASASSLISPLWGALILGPLLALAGMVGDLAESLLKRDLGTKDSGTWLPGLGGVWDVTDSLIAAILPAFLWFSAGVGA